MNTDAEPLFVQIASFVADLIVDGTLKPGERAPSTNQLAQFHEINPATARKGLALLVDDTGSTAADDVTGAVSFAVALSCAFATGTSAIEPATAAASESPTARFALDVAAIITSRE